MNQKIQDLRPIVGHDFFDFLKHFELDPSDPIIKLKEAPERFFFILLNCNITFLL